MLQYSSGCQDWHVPPRFGDRWLAVAADCACLPPLARPRRIWVVQSINKKKDCIMKKHMSAFVSFNLATLSRIAALCEHPAKSRIKYLSRLCWSCLSFGAILLAAPTLHADTPIYYYPNLFDISITFGCDCTCFCDTHTVETNNPVSMFLNANPVAFIKST